MSGYRTKKFSQLTNSSVKTLRHYKKIGVLKPTQSIHGFSLYSDDDKLRLQKIMALKYMGYSLDEIKLMLRNKNMGLGDFSDEQSTVLTKEFTAARDKMWFDQQIKIHAQRYGTLNWPMVCEVLRLLQVSGETLNWQRQYYTESEYSELAQVTLQYSPEWWEDHYARWRALFKEVEGQLHTDPHGPVGLMLLTKWRAMKAEVPLSAEVQRKSWEALQKGLMPQDSFPYNPLVIEYITKAAEKFREVEQMAAVVV